MKKIAMTGFVLALLGSAAVLRAQEPPKPPGPQKEHEWLKQFVGDWNSECEVILEPGKPPMKCKGTETVRDIGGLWVILENKSVLMGQPVTGLLTIGYDPQKKKYVGTWIDSMQTYLWKYEGTVDASGNVLTLETEGPSHNDPKKLSRYKEVIEFKNKDHKIFTSHIQDESGKWVSFMTMNYQRKK